MMPCPRCGADTRVIDTRGITRTRRCVSCDERFATREIAATDLEVVGRIVAYGGEAKGTRRGA